MTLKTQHRIQDAAIAALILGIILWVLFGGLK